MNGKWNAHVGYHKDAIDEQLPKPLASLTIQEVEDWINAAIFADQQTSGLKNWETSQCLAILKDAKSGWKSGWNTSSSIHTPMFDR